MLTKSNVKLIKSLQQKKYRQKTGLFVVEGIKSVNEFLKGKYKLANIYGIKDTENQLSYEIEIVTERELKSISGFTTPQKVIAVFEQRKNEFPIEFEGLQLALDNIRDPGNLGTIIRMCDWFGIENLFCSTGTTDVYSPKVVQSTMGSLNRVNVNYVDLPEFIKPYPKEVYGAFLEGKNLYKTELSSSGLLVLGNEANGISPEIEKLCTQRITIPQGNVGKETESLNVATATAVILGEFFSRKD